MYGGFFPSRSGNAGDQKRKRNRFASLYAPCFADGGDSVVCAFIGTTQIGWNFGDGNVLQLSLFTAFALAVLFYGVMLAGVAVMGRVIWWMARNYHNGHRLRAVWFLPAMSRRRCF